MGDGVTLPAAHEPSPVVVPPTDAYSRHSQHRLYSTRGPGEKKPASDLLRIPAPPPIQWHALALPSRHRVYQRYGVMPWSARSSDHGGPPRTTQPAPKGSNSYRRMWDVDESVNRVGEIVVARNAAATRTKSDVVAESHLYDGSWGDGRPEGDLFAAHTIMDAEVTKMDSDVWETHLRAQQAAEFAPGYYSSMLTEAINKAIQPAAQECPEPSVVPQIESVAATNIDDGTSLGFGSPRHRNRLVLRIGQHQRFGRVLTEDETKHVDQLDAARKAAVAAPTPPATPPEKPFPENIPPIFGT